MRITHVVYSLARGGQEKLLMDLGLCQQRSGHQVSVCSITGKEGPFARVLEDSDIPVVAFERWGWIGLGVLDQLAREFKGFGSNVVHTHNTAPQVFGGLAARIAGVPAVVNTRHGAGGTGVNHVREGVFRLSQVLADRVVFVCDGARRQHVARDVVPAEKALTIYNGVPLESYAVALEPGARREMLDQLECDPGCRVVGLVARLEPIKDVPTLVRAAASVLRRAPETRFLVIGGGSQEPQLRRLIRELGLEGAISLLGDRRDVGRLLALLDLFVLSSINEGMPLTLIEAMSAAVPIVATRVGGIPEVVVHDETGLLVPPRSPDALAAAMLELLRDPERARSMGLRGRERAQQLFRVESMAAAYEAVYEAALAPRR